MTLLACLLACLLASLRACQVLLCITEWSSNVALGDVRLQVLRVCVLGGKADILMHGTVMARGLHLV
jgi:hypothetical protein